MTSRSGSAPGGGASRSSRCMPEWNVPHSAQRTDPFGSIHPHTGHDDLPLNARRESSAVILSLQENVFLVTSDNVSSIVLFYSHSFLFIVEFYYCPEHIFIFKRETDM